MHEIVVTKRTLASIEVGRQDEKNLWRVSSIVSALVSIIICYFSH